MAERSNAAVLKTVEPVRVPGVRIPLSPPKKVNEAKGSHFFQGEMPERSNGAVSKTVDLSNWVRGFESLSLRKRNEGSKGFRFFIETRQLLFIPKELITPMGFDV